MLAIVLLLLGISYYISTRVSKPQVMPSMSADSSPSSASKLEKVVTPSKVEEDVVPVKYQPKEYKIGVSERVDCCSGNTCLPYTNGLRMTEDEWECDMLQFFEHI